MAMTHEITAGTIRNKRQKRKGRGRSSGRGKTSGRGTKGSGAHGGDVHWIPGREGGQTPLFRRFPKRGFSNVNFETKYHVINLTQLDSFEDGASVDQAVLIEKGVVPDDRLPLKVLGDGKLSKKLTVSAAKFSKSAHAAITGAGGAANNPKGEAFQFPKEKKKFVPRKEAKGGKKKGGEEAAAPAAEEKKAE